MFYAMFFEKGCGFVEFSTVSDAKAQVIQPYPVRTEAIVGESLARVPRRRKSQQYVPVGQHKSWQ